MVSLTTFAETQLVCLSFIPTIAVFPVGPLPSIFALLDLCIFLLLPPM